MSDLKTAIEYFENIEFDTCCNGSDCGCMGKPIDPEYYILQDMKKAQKKIQDLETAYEGLKILTKMRDDEIKDLKANLAKAHLDGVGKSIQFLRALQDKSSHWKEWNHSCDVKFAPVELSDWLLINVYRKEEKETKCTTN